MTDRRGTQNHSGQHFELQPTLATTKEIHYKQERRPITLRKGKEGDQENHGEEAGEEEADEGGGMELREEAGRGIRRARAIPSQGSKMNKLRQRKTRNSSLANTRQERADQPWPKTLSSQLSVVRLTQKGKETRVKRIEAGNDKCKKSKANIGCRHPILWITAWSPEMAHNEGGKR